MPLRLPASPLPRFLARVLFFALCTIPLATKAQYFSIGTDPASIRWSQVRTPHFRIIFPKTLDSQAIYIANALEYIREPASASLEALPKKWPIILHNRSVISNAYTPYAPKRIDMITTPPQDNYPQDWMDQLVLHEFRHTVQYASVNRGLTKALTFLLGEQAVPAMIGLFVPLWFVEGDAVSAETSLSLTGRGRVPSFHMKLRAQYLDKGIYSYDKAVNGSFKDFTPDRYELGYQLVGNTRIEFGEETWSKVLHKTGNIPVMLVPFSNTLFRQTGYGKSRLYSKISSDLVQSWMTADSAIALSQYDPALRKADRFYTNRTQPNQLANRDIVLRKTSIDDIPRIVAIDPAGKEKIIINPGSLTDDNLSASGNLVCWAELDRNPRWSLRNYSVIMVHDFTSGQTRQLTFKTRFFSPELSPDGTMIVAVEVDEYNHCFLVILDTDSSYVIHRFPAPDNNFLSYPAWSPDQKEIAVIMSRQQGKSLAIANIGTGQFKSLIPYSAVEISKPAYWGDFILYTSGYTGTDNIFVIEKNSGKLYQVTSSRFGATDANVSPNDSVLYYSEYTSGGYIPVYATMNPDSWILYDTINEYKWDMAEQLAAQEHFIFRSGHVPDTSYKVKPYRKGLNLFNFHSWAPLYFDIDNFDVQPGVMAMSQNLLGTSYTTLGFAYDMNEKTGRYYLKYSYEGLYPAFDLQADYGIRKAIYTDTIHEDTIRYKFHELNLSTGIRIPLNWNVQSWYFGIQPYAGYTIKFQKMLPGTDLDFRHDRLNTLESYLFLYAQSRQSSRDLQPRWGQQLQLNYRIAPFDSDVSNNIFAAQAILFFPGIVKHHGLKVYCGYQYRQVDFYRYGDIVRVPRGYSGLYSDDFISCSASYLAPIAYPDWNIGPILYLKRIKASVFYDWMMDFDANPSDIYQSCGLDLAFDFHLFRLFVPLEAGLRTIYLPNTGTFEFEFLYSVNIGDLY